MRDVSVNKWKQSKWKRENQRDERKKEGTTTTTTTTTGNVSAVPSATRCGDKIKLAIRGGQNKRRNQTKHSGAAIIVSITIIQFGWMFSFVLLLSHRSTAAFYFGNRLRSLFTTTTTAATSSSSPSCSLRVPSHWHWLVVHSKVNQIRNDNKSESKKKTFHGDNIRADRNRESPSSPRQKWTARHQYSQRTTEHAAFGQCITWWLAVSSPLSMYALPRSMCSTRCPHVWVSDRSFSPRRWVCAWQATTPLLGHAHTHTHTAGCTGGGATHTTKHWKACAAPSIDRKWSRCRCLIGLSVDWCAPKFE